jgi:hypothetical protein
MMFQSEDQIHLTAARERGNILQNNVPNISQPKCTHGAIDATTFDGGRREFAAGSTHPFL